MSTPINYGAMHPTNCSPCPDCKDTGWVGDQEAGSGYREGKPTKNDEWQPCGCDRRELAKRRIARANAESIHPESKPDSE